MEVLGRYFDALRSQDWDALAETLAEDVERCGPYLDVVRGRDAYLAFLAKVLPTLRNYELTVLGIDRLEQGGLLARLTETLDVGGVRTEFPEAILFELDRDGRIARVDVYLKHPGGASGRVATPIGAGYRADA